jgi:hypothetical protein
MLRFEIVIVHGSKDNSILINLFIEIVVLPYVHLAHWYLSFFYENKT